MPGHPEGALPTGTMVAELVQVLRNLARPVPVRIAYDTDDAGRQGRRVWRRCS